MEERNRQIREVAYEQVETPRWMQDKHFNEVLFCEDFLAAHPMVCVDGSFFTVEAALLTRRAFGSRFMRCFARISPAARPAAPPVC